MAEDISANAVIGIPSWRSEATFSGGDWEEEYPVAMLGVEPLSRVARSKGVSLAATQFVATFATARPIRLLGLVRHNLSLLGRFRVTLYADAARTTVLYAGSWEDCWPPAYPHGSVGWEDDQFWSGVYSSREIEGYVWTRAIWLDAPYIAAAVLIEIDDTTNPAGYVEIGLCEIAQGWQVRRMFDLGASYGFRFRSLAVEADGGVQYFERREKPRRFAGVIKWMLRDEALARAFEHQRQYDIDRPFLWLPQPAVKTHWLRNAFLARNVDPGLFAYAFAGGALGRDSVPLSFEEVL